MDKPKRTVSEETRKKISDTMSGKTIPQETRDKISKSKKGVPTGPHSAKQRAHMREAHLGKKHSEESKKKIGAAQKGKILSVETRQKISASKTGRKRPKITSGNHPHAKRINQRDLDGKLIRTWDCMRDITEDPRFPSLYLIRNCCRGIKDAYNGFHWEYADEADCTDNTTSEE